MEVEGNLYIGTYGGGVDALLPSGGMINFAGSIGPFNVNLNPMHFDGEGLSVGTLQQGVWILLTSTGTWFHLTQGLGSNNLTAITCDDRFVYFSSDHGLTMLDREKLRSPQLTGASLVPDSRAQVIYFLED